MSNSARRWAVVALVVVVGMGIAGWAIFSGRDNGKEAEQAQQDQADKRKDEDQAADADFVMVGGVRRKRSDVESVQASAREARKAKPQPDPVDFGRTPTVAADASPQVAAAVQAIRARNHPERLSALARPVAFDSEQYAADPAGYLSVAEPGRVFQTAQPGPDVPRLRPISAGFQRITQGATVPLRVSAAPGAPVSFTTFDLGRFENQLTTVTVRADAEGMAEAAFTATAGTIDDIRILAGSPVASGQVRFVVNVALPAAADQANAAALFSDAE